MEQNMAYMLKRIGIWEIDKNVSSYNDSILQPIDDKESLDMLASFGIKKEFNDEMFYHAVELDDFLGEKVFFNLIGTINDKIYKIYFKFAQSDRSKVLPFRNKIRSHFYEYMSPQQFSNSKITKIKNGKLEIWSFEWGNILIEEMYLDTEIGSLWSTAIGITSNAVRSAKKVGFFNKLFNRP